MNEIVDTQEQSLPDVTSKESPVTLYLFTLAGALAAAAMVVWQLRQDWAKEVIAPWFALLVTMFIAAFALRQLDLWLPNQPIFPQLTRVSSRINMILGAVCITVALALTAIIIQRLLPDYKELWKGMVPLWLASLFLLLTGAWLLGAVGSGSPRAATASTFWSASPRRRWQEVAAFVLILALAIFLRTYRINSIPPGIYVDETNGALDALYILEGRSASPFGTGWYGTPNGYIYYMAGIFKWLGANWISLKIISLLPAILTVVAIYFLGRLVLGPMAGLSAMLLLAVNRWHLSMSRWGWNETAPPLFQILATYFLIRGLRDRRASDYALGGLLMGLSIYTYLSARLVVATLLLFILYWIFSDPSGIRVSLKRSWSGLIIFTLAAVVAVAPIAVTYSSEPFTLNNRIAEISIFREIRDQNSLKPLMQNLGDILKFFHQTGDHQGKHNLPDEPMADPITGLLFAVGLGYSILRWRDQRYFLLIIWLVIGLSGSFLSSHTESPQAYRSLTALPAVILMAADMLDRLTRVIHKTLQENLLTGSRPQLPAYIAGAIAVTALMGATVWESTIYFGRQAVSPAVEQGFNPIENRVAHEVIDALEKDKELYLSPKFSEYSPLRFLVYGVIKAKTGENTLDDRPYHSILPENDFPIADTGKDVLVLLDSNYGVLSDYVKSFYPDANVQMDKLSDGTPLYLRIKIPHEQIAALQGLTETVTFPDGRVEQNIVPQMDLQHQEASRIEWSGVVRVEHGGDYHFKGDGGLEVFLDDLPVRDIQYLGRGMYGLKAVWNAGDSPDAALTWKTPGGDWSRIPEGLLFHTQGQQHGLLGVYWNNLNWENTPVFHQVTPFLLLAWNREQPIVPNGPFSARYRGFIRIAEAGEYTFRIEADDGARLIIDGGTIGEGMVAGQPNSFEATVDLASGDHPIQVEYFQQGGGSALRLFWKYGNQPFTPVPPSVLIPGQP